MKIKNIVGFFILVFWAVISAILIIGLSFGKINTAGNRPSTGGTAPATIILFEIAKHNNAQSCWVIVDGKVYDLTSFISVHSGGVQAILNDCGRDGTNDFNVRDGKGPHPKSVQNTLNVYYIGNLTGN
jgi:cytochrome b involved in lipid metabolism